MEHPKDIGDRSTLAVLLALSSAGYPIFQPFGENTRCDVIIDEGARLARIQVKTGRLRMGAVRFAVCSNYGHHRNPDTNRRSYHGQIEYFAVFCPETAGVYLVPIQDLDVHAWGALRIAAPKNNQRARIRFAADYEIATVRCVPVQRPQVQDRAIGRTRTVAS